MVSVNLLSSAIKSRYQLVSLFIDFYKGYTVVDSLILIVSQATGYYL